MPLENTSAPAFFSLMQLVKLLCFYIRILIKGIMACTCVLKVQLGQEIIVPKIKLLRVKLL